MTRRLISSVCVAFVLIAAGCGDDGGDETSDPTVDDATVDDEATEPTDDDDGADDGADDGDDTEEVTEDTTVDQFDFSGGPPPGTRLVLGGSAGTAEISVECTGPGVGTVTFALRGGAPDETFEVQVGSTTGELVTDASGSGSASVDADVPQPAAVAVVGPDSVLRGQLQGC